MRQSEIAKLAGISRQAVYKLKKKGLTASEILSPRKTGRPQNPSIIIDGQRWCSIAQYAENNSVRINRIGYFIRCGRVEHIKICNVTYIKYNEKVFK